MPEISAKTDRPESVLLEARGVSLDFGSVSALSEVGMTVRTGEIVALVGPNGAGKTSMFNCISGFARPTRSEALRFRDLDLTTASRHQVARAGIGRTFQNLSLFAGSTVLENVLVGRHAKMRATVIGNLLRWRRSRGEDVRHRQAACEVLDLLGLAELRNMPVGGLPYGTRKRVELARALAAEPDLLLVDEPVAGMNPTETTELTQALRQAHTDRDLAVLLVEHDMSMVMEIADWITVLDFGQVIAEGPPQSIREDPRVRAAYLGASLDSPDRVATSDESRSSEGARA